MAKSATNEWTVSGRIARAVCIEHKAKATNTMRVDKHCGAPLPVALTQERKTGQTHVTVRLRISKAK